MFSIGFLTQFFSCTTQCLMFFFFFFKLGLMLFLNNFSTLIILTFSVLLFANITWLAGRLLIYL